MTTDESLAAANGWELVQWDAAYEAACDSVGAQYLSDTDPDDTDALAEGQKTVNDFVTNAWDEGMSHDAWVSAALRRLRPA